MFFSKRCDVLAMFLNNIDVDVFDDVLQNAKHRAYDASNDVNRPPLPPDHNLGQILNSDPASSYFPLERRHKSQRTSEIFLKIII